MADNKKDDYVVMSIRLPKEIHQELKIIAAQETRTISQQILHFIRLGMKGIKTYTEDQRRKVEPESSRAEGRANDMGAEK